MLLIGATLIYLDIVRRYEPLLLLPKGLSASLVNLPLHLLTDYKLDYRTFVPGRTIPMSISKPFTGTFLMHAMGPDVTEVMGTAVAASVFWGTIH